MDEQTIIAEFDITSSRVVLGPTLASDIDMTVYAEGAPVTHEGTTWFHVTVRADEFEDFEDALKTDPTVAESEVFARYGDRRIYRLTLASSIPVLTNYVASFGDELLDFQSTNEGWKVRIRTMDRESIRDFWEFCAENDIDCQLQRIFEMREPIGEVPVPIEQTEFEVLQAAHEGGYFEVPRETDLSDLANQFDVSESTMSARLRRALDHVVEGVMPGDWMPEDSINSE